MSRPDRLLRRLVPVAVAVALPLLLLLLRTLRQAPLAGGEHLDRLAGSREPAIYAFWHNRLLVCGHFVHVRLRRAGAPLGSLVSRSRDGEIGARIGGWLGVEIVRGSTSRGALSGLRKLYRLLAKRRISVVNAPDGPRGPVYVAQRGSVVLAQMSGVPIVPVGFAAARTWRLRSWDRLIIPKPFSRVAVVVGEPLEVAADTDLEAATERLRLALDRTVADAERTLEG